MSARSLLTRLRKLETDGTNPVLKKIGSLEQFADTVNRAINDKRVCAVDGPFLINCVRRWANETHQYNDGRMIESWADR